MKRLTEKDEYGNADIIALSDMMPELYADLSFSETNALTDALNRLAAYEETGLEPEEVAKVRDAYSNIAGKGVSFKRIHEMIQAERDGRLVVLPCKVGDVVYQTDGVRIYKGQIKRILFDADSITFDERAIGTSVFLTQEEAEAALEGENHET